jgi:penicillin V acylase-like amidase (Ntn superfamily)
MKEDSSSDTMVTGRRMHFAFNLREELRLFPARLSRF